MSEHLFISRLRLPKKPSGATSPDKRSTGKSVRDTQQQDKSPDKEDPSMHFLRMRFSQLV